MDMLYSASKGAKQEKGHIVTSINQAYGQVTREEGDTEYEISDITGAPVVNKETTYEAIPN